VTDPTDGESIWSRLRRRKVVQWGIVYVAGAWGLLQGLAYVTDTFHWPEQIQQLATLALLIGLPIVLVLAWYHGDRGEQRVSRAELAILTLLFLLGGGLFWRYQHAAQTASVATPSASIAPAAVLANDRSIAVLPFTDMSATKDQEYFSDGIAEELLNLLAKVPQLQVAARTSSFSYKGKDTRIAQIGQELNVAHVLEGSVRKSGNTLRITAQLVRAGDGYHLWSETYDRPLDDIFAVQDEIAGAVVEQLKIKLLGAAPKVRRANPEAYALVLKAIQLLRQYTHDSMEQAFALCQQALVIDPSNVAASNGLAGVYAAWGFLGQGPRSADENFRLSRETLNKALAIDPDYAQTHANLSYIAMRYDDDLTAAARHLEHALALEPANPDVIGMASYLSVALGRLSTAIDLAEYSTTHDPVNPLTYDAAGDANFRAGRLDEAIARYRAALSLRPDGIHTQYGLGVALLFKGDQAGALTAMQAEPDEGWRLTGLAVVYHALGKKAESDAALAELIEKHQKSWSSSIAWVFAYRREADAAFEWLDKAVANHDTGVMSFPTEPLLASLHNDPRWLPFLRKIGKAPEQLAAIKFDVKLPN